MAEERCTHPIVMVCRQTDKVFPAPGKPSAADPRLKIHQRVWSTRREKFTLTSVRPVCSRNRRKEQT
jgi:hypothetical protein